MYLEEAISRFPGSYLFIMGELNAYIGRLQNLRNQQVADFMESFVPRLPDTHHLKHPIIQPKDVVTS